jgi:hypothetical protein
LTLAPPPASLPDDPAVYALRPGDRLVRFYDPRHGSWDRARTFGPLRDVRFDHHVPPTGSGDTRAVWYAAMSLIGALSESFGRIGFIDRDAGRRVALVRTGATVPLLDLVGVAARRIGLTQEIAATTAYPLTQAWARAVYERYPRLWGIRWRGRQAGSVCVVITERAPAGSFTVVGDHPIDDAAVWPRIARAARRCRIKVI